MSSLGCYRVHANNISEVASVNLPRIRERLRIQALTEEAVLDHAARLGQPLCGPLLLNIPAHCKARLFSLMLGRAGHPFPEDRIWSLVAAGIRSAWRFPQMSVRKRLFVSAAFPVIPFLPRPWLRRNLPILMHLKAADNS